MRKILYLFLIPLVLLSCKDKKNYTFTNQIIPNPANIEFNNNVLEFKNKIFIVSDLNTEDGAKLKNYLTGLLSKSFDIEFVTGEKNEGVNLFLSLDNDLAPEAYELNIDDKGIKIESGDYIGLLWGIQTLRQLLPYDIENGTKIENAELPFLKISDEPRFGYRGMHLDVCRHFFTVDDVKSYIDMLVMHKLNTFHFHLTDDQGWRFDVPSLPKLAEIASQRKGTMERKQWGTHDGIPYGGYYTREEIGEIVKYAEDRFINVIPEIEMPGHALAALSAYPEIGCTGGPYEAETSWGVFDDIFCAGNEETFSFMEKVIDEVLVLFPNSPYIHVGGDEAPKVRWENCPKCQKRIKDEGLADEHELQSYFVTRMEKYISSKGRRIIGWDEILEGGLAPGATVLSWRGEEGGIAAAKLGHDFIMAPTDYCYFDYYQTRDTAGEPFGIGNFIDCEKIYNWEPLPASLNENEQEHMLGIQANLWTEYIHDRPHIEYMVLPRMAVLAENAWTKKPKSEYSQFKNRLQSIMKRYDVLGYNFAKHELE